MKEENNQFWPKTFDEWRIAPRIMLFVYMWMMVDSYQWFTTLPDPTTEQTALVGLVWGLFSLVVKFYLESKVDK